MSIPVARPRLPTTDEIASYLRRIDASRWYSNGGPLVQEFEERLAQHFSDGSARVATVANATIGLAVALLAHDLPHESLCMDLGSAQKRAVWSGFSPAHPFRAGVICLTSFRGETGLAVVIATLPPTNGECQSRWRPIRSRPLRRRPPRPPPPPSN